MPSLFAGRILLADRVVEGYIAVEAGRVADAGEGEPPGKPAATGWIVPGLVNAHTHMGDACLRDVAGKPGTVAELVGPGGWKHAHLARVGDGDVQDGMRRYAAEMAAVGVSHVIDFREGGAPGLRLLTQLRPELPVAVTALGRPAGSRGAFDEDEARQVLAAADGVGLPGLRDLPRRTLEAWAEAAHAARKPLSIHASEDRHDDVDALLALEPAFAVHMVHASDEDLEELAQAKVPVAVAPRSNRRFGLRTPVDRMLQAGVTVAVGTDNGMLNDGDLLAELAQARQWHPSIPVEDLLRMATHSGRRLLGLPPLGMPRAGQPADWVVLPADPLPRPASTKPRLEPAPAPRREAAA